jgi:hypothetical protein
VTPEREKRALALLSSLPLAAQLVFHLWQQGSIFAGRYAYLDRLAETTTPLATIVIGLVFVAPIGAWAVLLARALVGRDRIPGEARPGDPPIARALGGVIRVVSPIAATTVLAHATLFWVSRIVQGQPPLYAYDLGQTVLGQPMWLFVHALLVFGVTWHVAATLPDGLEAADLVSEDGRRSAFVVTAVFGACLFVLYAQLAGWLASGLGTFWPIEIVRPDAP